MGGDFADGKVPDRGCPHGGARALGDQRHQAAAWRRQEGIGAVLERAGRQPAVHAADEEADMRSLPALLAGCLIIALVPGCTASMSIGGPPSTAPRRQARPVHKPERRDGLLILTAQSVPTASLVPCLHELPADQVRTRVALDLGKPNDRVVTVALTRHCDVDDTIPLPSDRPATRRYEAVEHRTSGYRGQRYYVFVAGCISYRFDVRGSVADQAVATISRSLSFVNRAVLRRHVHVSSGGRVELDPPPAR